MLDPKIPILGQTKPEDAKLSAIHVRTEDGQLLQFPQVAAAMATPELIEAIAEAVYRRFQKGADESTAVEGVEYKPAVEGEYEAPGEWA